jgi:hypothetical protein
MAGRARLTRDQRGVIEVGLAGDGEVSWVELGLRVGVAATTVVREVERNRGRLKYCAEAAQVRAGREARRPKVARLVEFALVVISWSVESVAFRPVATGIPDTTTEHSTTRPPNRSPASPLPSPLMRKRTYAAQAWSA